MVMGAHHGCGGLANCRSKYLSGVGERRSRRARCDLDPLSEAISSVEAQNPEFFHVEAGRDGTEICGDHVRAVENG
jgi:hypothetical protein